MSEVAKIFVGLVDVIQIFFIYILRKRELESFHFPEHCRVVVPEDLIITQSARHVSTTH